MSGSDLEQASIQTEALASSGLNAIGCQGAYPNESGANEASRTSGSDFEHIKTCVGNEYASEWFHSLEKRDDFPEAHSVGGPDGEEMMMERKSLIDDKEECSWSDGRKNGKKERKEGRKKERMDGKLDA